MSAASARDAALRQLAAVPGVVGTAVFDAAGAVQAFAFPPVFDRAAVDALAAHLAGDAYFQAWLGAPDAALTMRFLDGSVTVRSLGGAWVLVLGTAQANEQLLAMSLTQLVRRLEALGAAAAPTASAAERLQQIARAELGDHADQAIELLAAAGPGADALAAAVAEVEKLVRLFISRKKAEEIARRMRDALDA